MVRKTQKRRTRKHKGSSKRRTRHRSRHGRSKKMHEGVQHNKNDNYNHQQGGKKKRRKSGGKRKLNGFFKAMLTAKKHKSPSFKYKGKTYKRHKHKHLFVYKKA